MTVLGNTGTLVKTDYVFSGWNTQADGGGTAYAAGATFAMATANVNLYATWAPTYTVTYDDNQSTGGNAPIDTHTYAQGATVTVLGNTDNLTKTGLMFVGWNTAANGSGTSYMPGATFTMGSSDVILYASWIDHWSRQFGAGAGKNTFGMDIAVDAQGNSYITGFTDGTLFSQPISGVQDACIIKYDAAGNRLFTRFLGAAGATTSGYAIAVDASGNIYIGGETDRQIDDQTVTGYRDAFIAKYNDNGTRLWIRFLGYGLASTAYRDIAVDQGGNCFVTGAKNTDAERDDVVVAKYNENGVQQWARVLSSAGGGYDAGKGVAVTADGSCYVAGYTGGSLGGQTLTGDSDLFILKYDADGNLQWLKQRGAPGTYTYGYALAIDSDNNSYIAGETTASLDGQTLAGSYDAFIIKYDGSGAWQWTRQLGQAGETLAYGIALDAGGRIYITGYTEGSLDGQPVRGDYDFYAAAYDPASSWQWVRQMGAAGVDTEGGGIAVDAESIYYTGYASGAFDGLPFSGGGYDAFVMRWAK